MRIFTDYEGNFNENPCSSACTCGQFMYLIPRNPPVPAPDTCTILAPSTGTLCAIFCPVLCKNSLSTDGLDALSPLVYTTPMTKKQIIERIFDLCQHKGGLEFDNDVVKEVLREAGSSTNPYDMTKVDDLSKLPDKLVSEGYTVIHLGDGRHKFVKCLDKIYYAFEPVTASETQDWPYRPSILAQRKAA